MNTAAQTFPVGAQVRTNRYLGQEDFSIEAVVDEVVTDGEPFHYVVRYTTPPRHSWDFAYARKVPSEIRPI